MTTLAVAEEFEAPTSEDVQRVLSYLFAHRSEAIRDFLGQKNLPVSGTKEKLQEASQTGHPELRLHRPEPGRD